MHLNEAILRPFADLQAMDESMPSSDRLHTWDDSRCRGTLHVRVGVFGFLCEAQPLLHDRFHDRLRTQNGPRYWNR